MHRRGLKNVRVRHDDALSRTHWARVEALLAEHYRRQGYEVEHCGTGSNGARYDGGIDLKLRRQDEYVLVECKHWNTKQVTHNAVHQLLGIMVNEGATGAILVTSGEFTDAAQRAAQRLGHVQLVDGTALRDALGPLPDQAGARDASSKDDAENGVDPASPWDPPIEPPYGGTRLLSRHPHRARWPWLLGAAVLVVLAVWLNRTPDEGELVRFRAAAEARLPPQRTATQRAIETGRLDAVAPARPGRSGLPAPMAKDGGAIDDTPLEAAPAPTWQRSPEELAEARRRADEAIKVIEATTPEM